VCVKDPLPQACGLLTRILHEPPATTVTTAVPPGVLGSRTLRCTPEEYASGPSPCGSPVARQSPRSRYGVSFVMRTRPPQPSRGPPPARAHWSASSSGHPGAPPTSGPRTGRPRCCNDAACSRQVSRNSDERQNRRIARGLQCVQTPVKLPSSSWPQKGAGYALAKRGIQEYVEDFPKGPPTVVEIMTCSTSGGNKDKRTTIPMAFEDAIHW
jgi:hypothetical protein